MLLQSSFKKNDQVSSNLNYHGKSVSHCRSYVIVNIQKVKRYLTFSLAHSIFLGSASCRNVLAANQKTFLYTRCHIHINFKRDFNSMVIKHSWRCTIKSCIVQIHYVLLNHLAMLSSDVNYPRYAIGKRDKLTGIEAHNVLFQVTIDFVRVVLYVWSKRREFVLLNIRPIDFLFLNYNFYWADWLHSIVMFKFV